MTGIPSNLKNFVSLFGEMQGLLHEYGEPLRYSWRPQCFVLRLYLAKLFKIKRFGIQTGLRKYGIGSGMLEKGYQLLVKKFVGLCRHVRWVPPYYRENPFRHCH